jgi:ankyrin repeat protein
VALPKLYVAAREGRADEVRDLLSQGVDPNERCDPVMDHGQFFEAVTPLMAAAASPRSNAETVAALLEGGADPFAVSDGEVTALWYAAGGGTCFTDSDDLDEDHPYRDWGGGDVERLRLLLDAGLPAHEAADNGRTALGEACSVGDPGRVALLIERGASVWPAKATGTKPKLDLPKPLQKMLDEMPELRPDPSGFDSFAVPLFLAAESGCLESVKLILAQGFPVDFRCDGENALNYAKTTEVAEFLLDHGLVVREGQFGFDAIDDAFENDRLGVAMALVRRIADPAERQSVLNQKLLMCSGVRMNPAAIRILIEEGADVNRLDKDYGSPLHYACWQGDGNGGRESEVTEEAVRTLLEAGADPNVKARGNFPLHEAVRGDWGSPTSVRVLLEYGAEVDARDDQGWTPLMAAADGGELDCIWLLLAAGADPRPAIPLAKKHLKTWEKIASDKPKKVARFLKNYGLDFFSVDDTIERHNEARDQARRALEVLESAANGKRA